MAAEIINEQEEEEKKQCELSFRTGGFPLHHHSETWAVALAGAKVCAFRFSSDRGQVETGRSFLENSPRSVRNTL